MRVAVEGITALALDVSEKNSYRQDVQAYG